MYAHVDHERTFEATNRTRTRNGDERDALSSDHTAVVYAPGVRRTIKRRAQRSDRRGAHVALSRYTTI